MPEEHRRETTEISRKKESNALCPPDYLSSFPSRSQFEDKSSSESDELRHVLKAESINVDRIARRMDVSSIGVFESGLCIAQEVSTQFPLV